MKSARMFSKEVAADTAGGLASEESSHGVDLKETRGTCGPCMNWQGGWQFYHRMSSNPKFQHGPSPSSDLPKNCSLAKLQRSEFLRNKRSQIQIGARCSRSTDMSHDKIYLLTKVVKLMLGQGHFPPGMGTVTIKRTFSRAKGGTLTTQCMVCVQLNISRDPP